MNEVQMTKQEIVDFVNCLSNLKVESGVKWGYAAARNRDSLMPIVKAIKESQNFGKDRADYRKYEEKRQELIKKHSVTKDGKSNVVDAGRGTLTRAVDPANFGAYLDDMDRLKEEHKDLVKELETHFSDFEKSLLDKETVKLRIVKTKDIPKGLLQMDYNTLWPMMEDPDTSQEGAKEA